MTMKEQGNIGIGSVVFSLKGRDTGACYAVVGVNEKRKVWVCDGYRHKLSQPKLKNIKHLRFDGDELTAIAEKLNAGKKVFDSELNSALRAYQTTSK